MSNYDNYELEELENAAVDKSVIAKRVGVGAGVFAVGAAAAYGASQIDANNTDDAELTQDDILAGSDAGEVSENTMEPQPQPEVHSQPEEVHVYHHIVEEPQPEPEPEPEPDPEIEFNSTTHYYDSEGNFVGQIDEGTYDGNSFAVIDADGDGDGDILLIDANGDGQFTDNEMVELEDNAYIMGNGSEHHDVNIDTGEEILYAHDPEVPEDIYIEEKDIAQIDDIHNDWDDEKTGEEYSDDLAENNPDYNNDGDVGHYSASMDHDGSSEEMVYENHEEIYDAYDHDGGDDTLAYDDTDTGDYMNYDDAVDDVAYDDSTDDITYDDAVDDVAYDDPVDDAIDDVAYDDSTDDFTADDHYDVL